MIIAFSGMAGFGYLVYLTKFERPATKRSYPYNGLEAELGGSADTPKVSRMGAFIVKFHIHEIGGS